MVNKEKRIEEINKNYKWFNEHKKTIIKENSNKIGFYAILVNYTIKGLYKKYEEAQKNATDYSLYSIQKLEKDNTVNMMGVFSLNG